MGALRASGAALLAIALPSSYVADVPPCKSAGRPAEKPLRGLVCVRHDQRIMVDQDRDFELVEERKQAQCIPQPKIG
jgi:hypothetical protein